MSLYPRSSRDLGILLQRFAALTVAFGPLRHFGAAQQSVAFRGTATVGEEPHSSCSRASKIISRWLEQFQTGATAQPGPMSARQVIVVYAVEITGAVQVSVKL